MRYIIESTFDPGQPERYSVVALRDDGREYARWYMPTYEAAQAFRDNINGPLPVTVAL